MSDPEQIRADIARQREAIAHTVDELRDDLDARARAAVRPAVVFGGVAVAALIAYVVWHRWP